MTSENKHLDNLYNKVTEDFKKTVGIETDISNYLLKGHLFVENLLDEVLAVYDVPITNWKRLTFYEKISLISKINPQFPTKSEYDYFCEDRDLIVRALYALNDVRNELAHNLLFQISESTVNRIGVVLGSEFIMHKYNHGQKKVRENLSFCMEKICNKLGFIIWSRTEDLKSQLEKSSKSNKS